MNKLEFLIALNSSEENYCFPHFRNAFLSCLNPEEICNFLDLEFNQPPDLRIKILDNISLNIKNNFLNCHEQLIENLLKLVVQKKQPNRNSISFCLSKMADVAPQETKEKIIRVFLKSPFTGIRKRAYNLLFLHWNETFESEISSIWKNDQSKILVKLIVEKFSINFLNSNFLKLESELNQLHKTKLLLYERTYPNNTEHLKKLSQKDGITYAYICANLGIVFSKQEAKKLASQYITDERIGIFIWALGVMELWDVLVEMYNNS